MASRDTDLNINVTASNRASDELRKVADEARQLEDGVDVPLTADDQASGDIDQVQAKANTLDGTTADVTVEATGNAAGDLDRIDSKARELDGRRARVTAEADVDQAIGDIDRLEAKLRDLDGRRAGLGVGGAAAAGAAAGAAVGAGLPVVGDISQSVTNAATLALDVQSIATLTGASLADAAKFAGVWRDAGLEIGDAVDLLIQVNGALEANPDMREKLKIGGATDLLEQFLLVVKGIQTEYDTAGSKAQASAVLFGEEGVKQVLRVQNAVGDFGRAVEQREPIVGDDDVERAREVNALMTDAKSKWDQAQIKALETVRLLFSKDLDDTIVRRLDELAGGRDDLSGTDILNAIGVRNDPGVRVLGSRPIGAAGPTTLFDQVVSGITNVIFEAPGSPTRNVDASRTYYRRNGVILS
jgi:hypothetical protein